MGDGRKEPSLMTQLNLVVNLANLIVGIIGIVIGILAIRRQK